MSKTRDTDHAADPLQEQLDAAEHLARLMVGEDDERFILVFQSLINVVDGFHARPRGGAARPGALGAPPDRQARTSRRPERAAWR